MKTYQIRQNAGANGINYMDFQLRSDDPAFSLATASVGEIKVRRESSDPIVEETWSTVIIGSPTVTQVTLRRVLQVTDVPDKGILLLKPQVTTTLGVLDQFEAVQLQVIDPFANPNNP